MIRYGYLWAEEAEAGKDEGAKDRPVAVVAVMTASSKGVSRVIVLPITHSEPRGDTKGIEVPAAVARRLGLDDDRCWVVVTEANRFLWPGPDLRAVPGKSPRTATYGFFPPGLFARVRDRYLDLYGQGAVGNVNRSE